MQADMGCAWLIVTSYMYQSGKQKTFAFLGFKLHVFILLDLQTGETCQKLSCNKVKISTFIFDV